MFLDEGTYRSRFASSSSLPGTPFTITSARVQMDLLAPRGRLTPSAPVACLTCLKCCKASLASSSGPIFSSAYSRGHVCSTSLCCRCLSATASGASLSAVRRFHARQRWATFSSLAIRYRSSAASSAHQRHQPLASSSMSRRAQRGHTSATGTARLVPGRRAGGVLDDADMSYGTWLVVNADGTGEPQQITDIEARSWGQE
jgi:hypothetical protein